VDHHRQHNQEEARVVRITSGRPEEGVEQVFQKGVKPFIHVQALLFDQQR
jgi:hypothetical protein